VEDLRSRALGGSAAEIVDKIGAFAEAGAQTVYLQVLDLADLDHLADLAAQVLPQV
jgi:alkanesulfonate monooxygenase SsuD/methylene tetrahydromethanopterin reductase-like flavin-dependent oxidoreductase (luciferase family)